MPARTSTVNLSISFKTVIICVASRSTMNYSSAMTNILAGTPGVSQIQLNSGTAIGYVESMSFICIGY